MYTCTCISTYLFFKIIFFDQRSYEKNKIANKFSLSFEAFQFLNELEVIKTKQLGVVFVILRFYVSESAGHTTM